MSRVIMVFVWNIFLFGVMLCLLKTLADLAVGQIGFKEAAKRLYVTVVWPLMLFTDDGRRRLSGIFSKNNQ